MRFHTFCPFSASPNSLAPYKARTYWVFDHFARIENLLDCIEVFSPDTEMPSEFRGMALFDAARSFIPASCYNKLKDDKIETKENSYVRRSQTRN